MSHYKKAPPRLEPGQGQKETNCGFSSTLATGAQARNHRDLFAEAREVYTIADAWVMLRLPGEPKASCRSPFREEGNPSFTIFDDGRAWKDHGTGEGGDVIDFIRHAIGGDFRDVRDWLKERLGIDYYDHGTGKAPSRPAKAPAPSKVIQWPVELVGGTTATWKAFAVKRGMTPAGVTLAVHLGILRFCRLKDGTACFVVTDPERRSAEIRRIDGMPFGDTKVYRLAGVEKAWPVGCEQLRHAPPASAVMLTEGSTDLLTAIDLYCRYREEGGPRSWVPVAILGAGCKDLAPDAAALIRGRHCRLVPDADDPGDRMTTHWTALLRENGSPVDVVKLPRGTDLTDCKSDISPTDLFPL